MLTVVASKTWILGSEAGRPAEPGLILQEKGQRRKGKTVLDSHKFSDNSLK